MKGEMSLENLEQLNAGVEALDRMVGKIIVRDNAQRAMAIEYIRVTIKPFRDRVLAWFAPTKKSAHETWKGIVAQEKAVTDRLDAMEKALRVAVSTFDAEQEEIRRAEEERLKKEAEAKAAAERERLMREAAAAETPEARIEAIEQAKAVKVADVRVASTVQRTGNDSVRKTWKARVLDPLALPRAFLVPDQRALDEFARKTEGREKIPGVEFYQDVGLMIR